MSGQLPLFKRKGNNVFVHRCTFCGDSQKNPTKCRGFHFQYEGSLVFKCHNCGKSCSTGNFIKELDPLLYKEYRLEVFKESHGEKRHFSNSNKKTKKPAKKPEDGSLFDSLMDNIKTLNSEHKAVELLKNRKIPAKYWGDLYYIDDMRKIGQLNPDIAKKLVVTEDRLVIPYRDRRDKIIGMTCRSFDKDSKLRYISIPIQKDFPQIYGYNKINMKKKVYVVEGAFDSMFIPNCIAVGGSNLKIIDRVLNKSQAILIFDCEPRNQQIVKLISQAIKLNYNIVLLPETGYKDINAMVLGGISQDKILKMIKENTVYGLSAKMKFQRWRKIR